jgi:hypothetical protein
MMMLPLVFWYFAIRSPKTLIFFHHHRIIIINSRSNLNKEPKGRQTSQAEREGRSTKHPKGGPDFS